MGKRSAWSKGARNSYSGQFAGRLIEMLELPAYRALSLAAHRVLARIEIEFGHHGGKHLENGRLPVSFDQFEEYGMDRHAIAPALRELEALGFIEITKRGYDKDVNREQIHLYRLTYRPAEGSPADGSHEWRRITTAEEAEAIADLARKSKRVRSPNGRKTKLARLSGISRDLDSSGGFPHCGESEMMTPERRPQSHGIAGDLPVPSRIPTVREPPTPMEGLVGETPTNRSGGNPHRQKSFRRAFPKGLQ